MWRGVFYTVCATFIALALMVNTSPAWWRVAMVVALILATSSATNFFNDYKKGGDSDGIAKRH